MVINAYAIFITLLLSLALSHIDKIGLFIQLKKSTSIGLEWYTASREITLQLDNLELIPGIQYGPLEPPEMTFDWRARSNW